MTTDFADLRGLAEKAYHDYALADIAVGGGMRATVSVPAFTAAASPSRILALLDRLSAAEGGSSPDAISTDKQVGTSEASEPNPSPTVPDEATRAAGEGELLPCPFCGGEARECHNGDVPFGMYWVLCEACHACPGDRNTREEAVTAWNTRPAPAVVSSDAEREAIKAALFRGRWQAAGKMSPDEVADQMTDAILALRAEPRAEAAEVITTAAIRHSSGVIVTVERPERHGECINFLNRCGLEYTETHGFLTSRGRFVDRTEAGLIAKAAGQGQPRANCNGNLFSEDLWDEPFVATLTERDPS